MTTPRNQNESRRAVGVSPPVITSPTPVDLRMSSRLEITPTPSKTPQSTCRNQRSVPEGLRPPLAWLLLAILLCSPTLAQEKRIYVPVDELDSVLARDKRGVLLSKAEFDKLVERAKQNEGSPAKVLVSNIDYEATIKGSQLLIDATVQFEQFTAGWHLLQLKTSGLSVEAAKLGDTQPPIGRADSNSIYLLTNEPGEHTLELTLSTPLANVGSDLVSAFSLPKASSATFTIEVPAKKQLALDNVLMPREGDEDQPAKLTFPVGGRDKVELRITDRKRSTKSEALVFMSTAYGVNVAPSEITWQAVTTLQSFGESLDKFVFSVPRTLEIAAVESTGLESWELADSEDRKSTEITLNFRQPIDGSRKVTFRGVMAVPVNQRWRLPSLRLPNAASEIGRVVVQHPVGTRLVIESMMGVRRTAQPTFRSKLAHASFDIWQPDFDLQLRLQLREREVLANMSTVIDVDENNVRLESLTGLECLNAPLFEVLATLPVDWEPTEVLLNNKAVAWQSVPREAGKQYLRIPFPGPLQPGGKNNLIIRATQSLDADDAGAAAFDIPEVGIDGAGVLEGVLQVRCADFQRVTPSELNGLDPVVLPNTKSEHPGFRYQEPGYSGTVNVTSKTTRLTAWTQSFTRLDPDRAVTWLDLHLDAIGGGLREFTLKLPESVGKKLRFAITQNCSPSVNIREQVAQGVENGQRTWLIRFDRRVRGAITLGGFMEEDRADDGNRIPEAIVDAADRQYGFIAVEASAEQHLTFDIDQAELQDVDPADLPSSRYSPKERIVAAYRYVQPAFIVTATEERFEREAVPTAVCRSLALQTVVGQSGQLRHRATMDFVAVGVQNLMMSLPDGTELWSTELNSTPIEVRRDGDTYLVRLDSSREPDASQQLVVTYESATDSMQTFGRLQQATPTFEVDVAGTRQPIEILHRNWDVLHSTDTVFDASNGLFEPTTSLGEQSFLARIPNLLSMPTQRSATDKLLMVGGVLLLVLVPTLCFRRWGGLGLVGVGAVALLAFLITIPLRSAKQEYARVVTMAPADNAVMEFGSEMDEEEAQLAPRSMSADDPYRIGEIQKARELAAQKFEGRPLSRRIVPQKSAPAFGSEQVTLPNQAPVPNVEPPSAELFSSDAKEKTGVRLSVPVEFQVPETYTTTSFAYQGTGNVDQQPELNVSYHGRSLNTIAPVAIALLVAILFWFCRSRSVGFRFVLAAMGLLVPLAVAPLVSSFWQLGVEGIFFGAIAGVGLWILNAIANRIKQLPYSRSDIRTAAILLTLLVPASASAQDNTLPTVVVPYDTDGQPLDAGRVFVPQDEFAKLWREANPEKVFGKAPVDALVSAATYSAKLIRDGDKAYMQVRGRFVLHNFRKQQVAVALPVSKIAIDKAELNGKPAPLRVVEVPAPLPKKQQTKQARPIPTTEILKVLLNEPGVSVLDLEFVVPVRLTGPAGRFELPMAPTSSALMNFEPPAEDLQIRVNGSSTAWRTGEGSTLQFPVSKGGTVTIEWQPKDEESGVDRVVHTDVTTAAIIDDAGLRVKSKLDYRIRQGSVSELTFKVPASVILQRVTGTDVGGWQQNEENNERTIRVFLRRAVDESTSVIVELFTQPDIKDTAAPIVVPDVRPTEVTREVGQIGIFADPSIVVRSGDISGSTQIEAGDFKTPTEFEIDKNKQPTLAYRYRVRPYRIVLSAVRPKARLKATADHAVFIERRRVRYTTRFNLKPQGAPRQRFAVLLPETFLPLEVFATNLADWYPYKDESGADLLIIDLAAPTTDTVELVVTGNLSRDEAAASATIPVPGMNNANSATAKLAIRIEESYTSSIDNSGNWKPIAPEVSSNEVRQLSKSPIQFAFQTNELVPEPIEVRLTQMPATMFGETVSVISLTNTAVDYSLNFKWIVRQSATDRFAFSGPDWLAGKLEIQCSGLRQVIESEPADGRVTWVLVLQEPVSTEHFALATATFPPVTSGNLRTPMLRCEPATTTANAIPVQNHYAVVLNQSERLITPVDASLKSVEPGELQIKIPTQYLDRATQIVTVPKSAPPQWTVTTPEQRTGAAATVNLVDLTTVVASDGSYRTKAIYTLRNRTRQFLPLVLPDGMNLLSVFVKDNPARPVVTTRDGQKLHLIALPRTSEADLSFPVEVVVGGRIANVNSKTGLNIAGTQLDLPVPEVLSLSADEEFGIPVAMTVWKVHVPKSWHAAVLKSSNLTMQDESESDVIRVMASLKEAVEQSVSFSKVGSYADGRYLTKQQAAYDNLQVAEQKLSADSSGVQNVEVQQELEELRRNINTLKSQLAAQTKAQNAARDRAKADADLAVTNKSNMFFNDLNRDIITGNSIVDLGETQSGEKFGFQQIDEMFAAPAAKGRVSGKGVDRYKNSYSRNRSGSKALDNFNSQNAIRAVPQVVPNSGFGVITQSDKQQGQMSFGGRLAPGAGGGLGGRGGGGRGMVQIQENIISGEQTEDDPFAPLVNESAFSGLDLEAQNGGRPTNEAIRSMNLQGDVILQPLEDIGSVVIKGNQADAEAVQKILSEVDAALMPTSQEIRVQPQWTQTGGLSLPIEVISDTTPLNFSKVGGAPTLSLRIRPADTMKKGYGLGWAVIWLGIAILALFAYRRKGTDGLLQFIPTALAIIGLLGFMLLPDGLSIAGFVLFVLGVILMAIMSTRRQAA